MNNVYDKAHELASVLKTTSEVIDFKSSKEKIDSNPSKQKMVDDFRKKQIEMYTLQLEGKQPSKEQLESFQGLFNLVSMDPEVKQYLESEMKFSQLLNDIMKILGDAAGVNLTPQS